MTEYFWGYSGEDQRIIKHCRHKGIQDRFALIGCIAHLVGLFSFLSCFYSFDMLFDNAYLALPVSLFFGWMIYNIYEVLLSTLAKPVLKQKYEDVIKYLSYSLRIGCIVFFAVFISKPLEAWIFAPQLSARVEQMKANELAVAEKRLSARFDDKSAALNRIIGQKEQLHYPEADILPYRRQLLMIAQDKAEALYKIALVLGGADYFIQRVQLLSGSGIFALSWLVTAAMATLFLLPVYLKWSIKSETPYLRAKEAVYKGKVEAHYAEFKALYSRLFKEKYGLEITFAERYLDPPYNTQRPTDQREYKDENDFFKRY